MFDPEIINKYFKIDLNDPVIFPKSTQVQMPGDNGNKVGGTYKSYYDKSKREYLVLTSLK